MPSTTPSRWILAVFALAAGVLGVAAVWALASVMLGGLQGWMALVAAADAALLLRLAGVAPGRVRSLAAVLATLATAALAAWFSVAGELAPLFGLRPLDAVLRLGTDTAVLLVRQAATVADLAWVGLSLPVAAWLGAGKKEE
ncbi:hypothetical protein [Coralloluteibacterium thermophilus]|uniref:Uncharacterized protein n=1 Tax=Coralloluteibacterium thermophilum TaxID=2707049 RepID=A0ABV9NMX8_9GAMM